MNASCAASFLSKPTGSLSMAWWLFGTMLQASGFPIVFELVRDGRIQFGLHWVTIIFWFQIIYYFYCGDNLRRLIWSDYQVWYTKIIAVKTAFQNSARCYLTPATYLFMVPRVGPRGFNAKNCHFWIHLLIYWFISFIYQFISLFLNLFDNLLIY